MVFNIDNNELFLEQQME